MLHIMEIIKKSIRILKTLLPLLAFAIPFLVLYFLYPNSFELTWKGRTFYIFFLWLVSLEFILDWEKLQASKVNKLRSVRTVALIIALLIPTIYAVVSNYCGLNAMITDLSRQNSIFWADWMPLSIEYLVFAVLFALITSLEYGTGGLKDFSISTFFLGIIGVIYIIDNVYPYGRFTPFQIFVPTTATLAASVLDLMGYTTSISYIENHPKYGSMPYLVATDSQGHPYGFAIAWPCAGVESLLIYTVTILLFLKKSAIPWWQMIIYFVVGAIITYFINVLRIATIFVIAMSGGDWLQFHNYYGQLYSITWIILYPLIIIGTRALWGRIRNR